MSLADDVREFIGIAREETLDLHVTVTFQAWLGQDNSGAATYSTTTPKALVEKKQQTIRNADGQLVQSSAYIGILEPLSPTTPNVGQTRNNPVDPARDIFTLPDGSTGPILRVDGFFDGGTGAPFYTQVWLG